MKDFPVFTTQNGIASLILKEVPYRQISYIHIQSSEAPDALLEECISFCRICGAEKIYATGSEFLSKYPLHTVIWKMQGQLEFNGYDIPEMFPVTESTVGRWRDIYNQKMQHVDHASTLELRDEKAIQASGSAYFIHKAGDLLGIGWLEGNEIRAIASCKKGAGEQICKALQSLRPQEQLTLEVVSTNAKALGLYERLGYIRTAEISRWYRVL